MSTSIENNSNVKDYLDIDSLKGDTSGVNSTFGKVNEYIGKGSDIGSIFNTDPIIGKTLGYFSNKASIIDAIDSGINGGYNGFMSSIAGTFTGATAGMLVASLAPQTKGLAHLFKIGLATYAGHEVGNFTKETFLNKEYRQLEFDPYDTSTHKFENGNWYDKNDNGTLSLIEDIEVIDNLNQGANESKNFNFYKNSTGEVVIEPKDPTFGEYYNIKTNGDIQTITDNGLTVSTRQTDGVIRTETYSSTEDTKKLTSLTVINPDGTYEYKNKVTGDYVSNSADEYIQTIKTSGVDGLNVKQLIVDKNTGKAVVKTFDGDNWKTEEYNSSSEVNSYLKDGGKFEYIDENSSVIKETDGSRVVFHSSINGEEKYILDKDGNLLSYEIKNENGEYQKYKGDNLNLESEALVETLNTPDYNKSTLEKSINNIDKSNLPEPSEVGVVPLSSGQTISHIAQNTPYNSIELLEYNDLTLEQAKNLPVGFEVKIPKDIQTMQSTDGTIKFYENHEGGGVAVVPSSEGKIRLTYDKGDFFENSPNKVTFGNETWTKGNDRVLFKSEVNTDDFKIDYTQDENGNSLVSNIEIKKQTSFEELAKHTKFSKEDLKAFNLSSEETIQAGSNISTPATKEPSIEGGYGDITHFTDNQGESIFIVPNEDGTTTTYGTFIDEFDNQASYSKESNGSINVTLSNEDGSTRTIISNADGYHFDSYSFGELENISFNTLPDGSKQMSSFVASSDMGYSEISKQLGISADILSTINGNHTDTILAGQTVSVPTGGVKTHESAYGDVEVYEIDNGNYVIKSPNENGTSTIYKTFEDGYGRTGVYEQNSDGSYTISLTNSDGSQRVIQQDSKGEVTDSADSNFSDGLTKTAIGQIGSLIIANNQDFSNIEKVAVSTTIATIADLATYENDINSDVAKKEGWENLKGAAVSFAVSSYFAKNDNISDWIGADGTFGGDMLDFSTQYVIAYEVAAYVNSLNSTTTAYEAGKSISWEGLGSAVGGYVGNYLGNKVADSWIDTKEESMGGSVGSAVGAYVGASIAVATAGAANGMLMGMKVGSFAGPIGALIGAFIGVIVGSLLGGLFGGTPPPPEAEAFLEFDEETGTYKLIDSSSENGGNEKAMINIGNNFAKQLINMFKVPGGQLIDANGMPEILVAQYDDTVKINGHNGDFDRVQAMMADALSEQIPFINVEGGDPYILRAINHTNDKFLEGNPDAQIGRANLNELYDNIAIAQDYSKYMNEVMIIVDANGKPITNQEELLLINNEYIAIQAIDDLDERNAAMEAFATKYTFTNQKVYVDALLEEVTSEDILLYQNNRKILIDGFDNEIATEKARLSSLENALASIENDFEKLQTKYNYAVTIEEKAEILTQIEALEAKEQLLIAQKEQTQNQIETLTTEKAASIVAYDEEHFKEIDALHWQDVFVQAKALRLDEHHYSEDFNKLNSEIAQFNYDEHEKNGDLLEIDYEEYLKEVALQRLDGYKVVVQKEVELQSLKSQKEKSDETLEKIAKLETEISQLTEQKNSALMILDEIGYDVQGGYEKFAHAYTSHFSNLENKIQPPTFLEFLQRSDVLEASLKDDLKVEITPERFEELLELAEIENPLDNFEPPKDLFSFAGKSIHDLQFELINDQLIITTNDKDLSADEAVVASQSFVIKDWASWNKEFSHLDLPDGTKINLKALLDVIGVEEGGGKVDVSEAFSSILADDETLSSYLDKFDSNHIFLDTPLDDQIKAFFGDNFIVTKEGDDVIHTGAGNDTAVLGAGKDSFDGGLGIDTVSYEASDSSVHVDLENGGTLGDAQGDSYKNVENIIGTKANDVLSGNNQDNHIQSGDGNDVLVGAEGSDSLDGGEGIDLANYETSKDAIEINLENGFTTGGDATGDKLTNIEAIKASNYNDTLFADEQSNIIYGESGDDRIHGGAGNDVINAGEGNDYLKGGEGNDEIRGDSGNDILLGGAGDDILKGGEGRNIIDGEEGDDLVTYAGLSSSYSIMFSSNDTLYIVSDDGSIKDILRNVEEIAFEDAVFTVDYTNQVLVKKVVFENVEAVQEEDPVVTNENSGANQAAAIATAAMVGTVAAAQTVETSSDEADYLSDTSNEEKDDNDESTVKQEEQTRFVVPVLTNENVIFEDVQRIIAFEQNQNSVDTSVNTYENSNEEQSNTLEKKSSPTIGTSDQQLPVAQENVVLENQDVDTTVVLETSEDADVDVVEEEALPELLAPTITLDTVEVLEDGILSGIRISNPNLDSSIEVIITGVPDGVVLSAGVLRANSEWFLQQKDLENLKIIPIENDANDFDIQIKATVNDIHGRVIQNVFNSTIVIHAVADEPNFEVEKLTGALEDEMVPITISTSLVDDVGGADGEERIVLGIENVPSDAVLTAGSRDSDSGIWYLVPEDLENLQLRPGLHNGDDFTLKVTAYTIESENESMASVSEEIHVEISAVADTPILEVSNATGDEDKQIALDISSSFVDNDSSEILTIAIENVPEHATLNKGTKDEDGVWNLTRSELGNLLLTPSLHDAEDFTLTVIAKTKEKENGHEATISKDIDVSVNAVADKVEIDLTQQLTGEEKVSAAEDASIVFLDIASNFIDKDGSESVHYIIEGLPVGAAFNQGEELTQGKWKVLPTQLQDLGFTLKEHSDDDFRLKITAVTTEAENGHQQETVKYIDCEIESVADFANLSISNAQGYQNDFIDLDIESSLIDKDGSESLKIVIEQVPNNAILNKGSKDADGNWHLSVEELEGLKIRPEFNSTQDFELKIKAITTEAKDGSTEESVALLNVKVNEIPKDASLIVNATQTLEDETCYLDIKIDHSSLNKNDAVFLELDIPSELSLNQGEKLANGNWKLREEELTNLQIVTPENYSNSFLINIATTVIKSNGNVIKSKIVTKLPVDILPVADEVTLEVEDITINEDRLIYLNIESKLHDLDGSEKLHLEIEGVPTGFLLNVGEKDGDKWIVNQEEIPFIALLPSENYSGELDLTIHAISTESNSDNYQLTKTIKIDIVEEIDPPILNITDTFIKDNSASLNIQAELRDIDSSESLVVRISELPQGATLSKGILHEDGSYHLSLEELTDLEVEGLNNEAVSLKVEAINDSVTVTKSINIQPIVLELPFLIDSESADYNNLMESIENAEEGADVTIKVSGIPTDATLSLGEKTTDNDYIIQKEDLSKVTIEGVDNQNLNLSFEITSRTEERFEPIDKDVGLSISSSNFLVQEDTGFKTKYDELVDFLGSQEAKFQVIGIPESYSVEPLGVKEGDIYTFTKEEVENLTLDGENSDLSLTLRALREPLIETSSVSQNFDTTINESRLPPYLNINNLNISTTTQDGAKEEFSDAIDNVHSGGGNDHIYSKSGADTIYSDQSNGKVAVRLDVLSDSSDIKINEKIIYRIEPLPEGTVSNFGYLNEGTLIIEKGEIDNTLVLTYPYQQETVSLNISANVVDENEVTNYLVSSSVILNVEPLDVSGNDYIDSGAMSDYINSGDRDDVILAKEGDDLILAGKGNDFINGGAGADRIDSGSGDDTIVMDFEDFDNNKFITEIVNAGEGFDTVIINDDKGVAFDMELTQVEKFVGGAGNDNILGSDDSDIIIGGAGSDTYNTGKGDDTIYIDAEDLKAQTSRFIDMGEGYDKVYVDDFKNVTFDVSGINAEEVIFGSGNDVIKNSASEEVKIFGMDGDDTIFASSANDILDGGEGRDTIDYSNSEMGVSVNLATGEVWGGLAQGDSISNFENIIGTNQDDNLVGNNENNIFDAKAGNNVIDGFGGVNRVLLDGELRDYVNSNKIITAFDSTATVFSSSGINELSNINILEFDDYNVFIDGTVNAPFVYDDELSTTEDKSLTVNQSVLLENDFSLEKSELRIVEVKNSENGIVQLNSNGTISFTPHQNYNSSTNNTFDKSSALYKGRAGFEYVVEDEHGNRSTAFSNVNVSAVNDAPTISAHSFYRRSRITGHGKIVVNDIDSDVSAMSVRVVSSLTFSYEGPRIYVWDEGGPSSWTSKTFTRTGYVNVNGRTPDDNGVFHYDYRGSYLRDNRMDMFEMRPFVLSVSDQGDVGTGQNQEHVLVHTGTYYRRWKRDPVVVDLDGDGVEIEERYFDAHKDVYTAVNSDDAILVWDIDQDGTISSDLETNWVTLSQTAENDLDVLREIFDTNKDGIFNEEDEQWKNFALWQDKNSDGLVSDDEFIQISDSNILEFDLEKNSEKVEEEPIVEFATYTTKQGDIRDIAAAYLDITSTQEKLSDEDALILQQAIKLNEQLAAEVSENENYIALELIENIDENEIIEENIA